MISAVDRECIAVWVEHGIPDIQTAATVPALLTRLVAAHDDLVGLVDQLLDMVPAAAADEVES